MKQLNYKIYIVIARLNLLYSFLVLFIHAINSVLAAGLRNSKNSRSNVRLNFLKGGVYIW